MARSFGLIIFLILYIEGIYGANESQSKGEPASESPKASSENKATNEGAPSGGDAPAEGGAEEQNEPVKLESSHYYKHKKSLHYSVYSYPFSEELLNRLKHPNVVIGFKFNERSGVFDLPFCSLSDKGWKCIDVYMCIHRCPVLVRVQTDGDPEEQDDECDSKVEKPLKTYSYFFKLNPTTGNFDNFKIPFIADKYHTDLCTGLIYYKLSNCDTVLTTFYDLLGNNWKSLFETGCKEHPQSSSQPMNPPLELTVEEDGAKKVAKPRKARATQEKKVEQLPEKKAKAVEEEPKVEKEEAVKQPVVEPVVEETKPKEFKLDDLECPPADEEPYLRETVVGASLEEIKDMYTKVGLMKYGMRAHDDILRPSLYYSNKSDGYTTFSYYVSDRKGPKLSYPGVIERILFNGQELPFSETAVLPYHPTLSLDLYTCRHNSPLLLGFYQSNQYFYYSLDIDSGLWTNYSIHSLRAFQQVGQEGVVSYGFQSSKALKRFSEVLVAECAAISPKVCKYESDNHPGFDDLVSPPLEIKMKSVELGEIPQEAPLFGRISLRDAYEYVSVSERNGLFTLTPSNCYFSKHSDLFSYYFYLDVECATALTQPYVPEKFLFNGVEFQFGDKAQLPTRLPLTLEILTCNHNDPLLLNLRTSEENVYFAFDQDSGRWNNHSLSTLKNFEQVAQDGSVSYSCDTRAGFSNVHNYNCLIGECEKISSRVCRDHTSVQLDQPYQPDFQVQTRFVELPFSEEGSVASLEEEEQVENRHLDSSLLLEHLSSKSLEDGYTQYVFSIDPDHRSQLMRPNLLKQFLFNGQELPFSETAVLPSRLPLTLEVLTCSHDSALLVTFKSTLESYFYYLDIDSGLWTNYFVDGLKEYERTDEHGVRYYMAYNPEDREKVESLTSTNFFVFSRGSCPHHHAQPQLSEPTLSIQVAPPKLSKRYTSSLYSDSSVMKPLV